MIYQDVQWLHLEDLLVWLRLHHDPTCDALAGQIEHHVEADTGHQQSHPARTRLRIVRSDEHF
ncbi:hypothetical protein [Amycolatopsis sp. NPDC004079]|uniref:hypothetical protein n=1 Tax=Amycolatopsis sp. NPDC004079 TaxID=3154549 RepID=UPI0033A8F374